MKKKRLFLGLALYFSVFVSIYGQKTIDEVLNQFNKESVPYISAEELQHLEKIALLDARKKEEYDISHLKNAKWVGHQSFELDSVLKKFPDQSTPIVVYCSIGVRSENIGEKLQKAGYTNVQNLYGGIFRWKNNGLPVYDPNGQETEKVHAFSKHWGRLLTKGEKIYSRKSKRN